VKVYLVRHGESVYNAEERIQGHQDIPLSGLGLRQAEAIARRLAPVRLDAVYSSDLIRASATAESIARPHGLPVQTTLLLRESRLGVIEGLTRAEVEARYPADQHEWRRNPLTARPPGAETVDDLIARCGRFVSEMLANMPEDAQVLVVGHGGSSRGVIAAGLGLPSDIYRKTHFSNASLSIIELGKSPAFWLLNDTSHLNSMRTDEEEMDSIAH
jgi:broad specificity phosphatase PhoE